MSVVVCSSCSEDNQHNTERTGYVEWPIIEITTTLW